MKPIVRCTLVFLCAPVFAALLLTQLSVAQTPSSQASQATLPSETPAHFESATATFDYTRRDVMIPMRDGVKLHTVILVPKGAKNAPILLTRTPYDATALTSHIPSSHLGPALYGYDNATDVIVYHAPSEASFIELPMVSAPKWIAEKPFERSYLFT